MKKLPIYVFLSTFGLVGLGLFLYQVHSFYLLQKNWIQVPATMPSSKKSVSGKGNISIKAKYKYIYQDKDYTGDKVDFSLGSNNFSRTRKDSQLAYINSKEFQVYINPEHPQESVIDKSPPIEIFAFGSTFIIFPCFIGIIFFFFIFNSLLKKIFGKSHKIFQLSCTLAIIFFLFSTVYCLILFPLTIGTTLTFLIDIFIVSLIGWLILTSVMPDKVLNKRIDEVYNRS